MKKFFALACFPLLVIHKIIFSVHEKGTRVPKSYKDNLSEHEVGTIMFGRN